MITPVLLCGGTGTRLWPLSRKSYPKQFAQVLGENSLFQSSALRSSGQGFAAPILLTASDFRFIVTEQLQEAGIDKGAILIEPEGRNTAPATLAAALYLAQTDPDAIMLVAPSDHVIPDINAFREAVATAAGEARNGRLVTLGIPPTHPETGYGYLQVDGPVPDDHFGSVPLGRFVEKPGPAEAERMLQQGGYLWNAGIFVFSAATIIAAFEACAPDLVDPVRRAIDGAERDLGFLRLASDAWDEVESVSLDYAVMEKADNLSVVPFAAGWSDLGSWEAVWREQGPDADGVALGGHATGLDCHDTLLRSEVEGQEIVGIGLDNIVAVAMPDAVLVADKRRTQDVRQAVTALKAKSAKQAEQFPRDYRPWGWFESLVIGDRFQVKRIVVKAGGILSLQSHVHRAEHWIVVGGTAKVTVGDEIKLISENQSIYIPLGEKHRMENPGKVPLTLIEVQTGAYLGEDDILRYEDAYARG